MRQRRTQLVQCEVSCKCCCGDAAIFFIRRIESCVRKAPDGKPCVGRGVVSIDKFNDHAPSIQVVSIPFNLLSHIVSQW